MKACCGIKMEARKVKYTAERFMEEVQKYECLYNKYFKDRNKKSNAWNAVVSQFHDLSQSEAVNKFKNNRSAYYTRFLKRKKSTPSGSGRDGVRTPNEFQNLEWLSTFIDHRPTWHNLKKRTSTDAGSDSEEEESQNENYWKKADPLQRLQ